MAQINETPPDAAASRSSEPVRNLVYVVHREEPGRPAAVRRAPRARGHGAAPRRRAGRRRRRARGARRRGASTAATMLLPAAGATAATTVLPSAAAGDSRTRPSRTSPTTKKRSPWTWPLIVLIALLALVLIGTIIALVAEQPAAASRPDHDITSSDLVDADRPPRRRTADQRGADDDPGRPQLVHRHERRRGGSAARGARPAPSTASAGDGRDRRPDRSNTVYRREPDAATSSRARTIDAHVSTRPGGAERAAAAPDDHGRPGRARRATRSPSTGRLQSCPAGQTAQRVQRHGRDR